MLFKHKIFSLLTRTRLEECDKIKIKMMGHSALSTKAQKNEALI